MSYKPPKGWATATIPQLISYNGLFVDGDWIESKDQNPNGEVRLIQLSDIGDGEFKDKSSRFLTLSRANELNCTFLKEGDLLIARMPDPIGRACIFPLKGTNRYVTAVDIAIVRTGINGVNNKFLNYLINSPAIRKKIETYQSGTTRRRISRTNLGTIELPIPPLKEQVRIVRKLDQLFSELEKSIEQLTFSLRQLNSYRKSLFLQAFEFKVDTAIHTTAWKYSKLNEVLTFIGSGVTPKGGKSVYRNSGITFLRSQNIYPNRLELSNVSYITEEMHEKMKRSKVQPFDVLLNITGASIGRCAYFPENLKEANVNQHVCILRINSEKIYYKYLSSYLNSPKAQNIIMDIQTGATRQGLNYSQIRNLEIPLPELSEQKSIVNELESRLTFCDNIEKNIKACLQQCRTLKQSILQKTFKGELVEQDPLDESADMLLQKISQEREKFLNDYKLTKKYTNLTIPKIKMAQKQLVELLEEYPDGISAKTLWQMSLYKDSIDDFYAQLKKHIEAGEIIELVRNGKEASLKLSDRHAS